MINSKLKYLQKEVRLVISRLLLSGCSQDTLQSQSATDDKQDATVTTESMALPTLNNLELGDEKLKVAAITSLIGDVIRQVSGVAIELTTLVEAGPNPYSHELVVRDLTAVSTPHNLISNGRDLEKGLGQALAQIQGTHHL